MRVLVVGGAGYIGSHMVKLLLSKGYDVTTFDNLSSGYRDAVVGGRFIEGDLRDRTSLDPCLSGGKFDGVFHFASFIQVGESVRDPSIYYRNNVANTLNLLEAMRDQDLDNLIFSSTAAIFGVPIALPIVEDHPKQPINPYGRSKWMVEQILDDFDRAYGFRSVSLRYFNAAGADPDAEIGERHDPETHLIPLILRSASGRGESVTVFGTDYDTPDGTCIRDYIHVNDLCEVHLLALDRLRGGAGTAVYNLGNGAGYSVQEVIDVARTVTGKEFRVNYGQRRAGDPDRLVADSGLARSQLGWAPRYADLEAIVRHAWQWELRISSGGADR